MVSASSSMLGLQAQAPSLPSPSEPIAAEPGVIEHLSRRLEQLREMLGRVAKWWMGLDFRYGQLPILMLVLAFWVITAKMAWQGEESATPLLRQSISEIRQERAKASSGAIGPALAPRTTGAARPASVAVPGDLPARATSGASRHPQPATTIQRTAQTSNNRGVNGWLASIQSWFSAEPAAREKVEGNPHRRVWVDMKTGLYYCPGADYYGFGGRERGKVMLQRDAEYEYFQPATGAPCQ